jgi:hypothetical protein
MMTEHHRVKDFRTLNDDIRPARSYMACSEPNGARQMVERTDWEEKAKGIIRGEMARRGVTYAQLVERLSEIGVDENERNLRNKVSRGKFTAGFLLQCLSAIGVTEMRL